MSKHPYNTHGKEWIVILLPNDNDLTQCSSYLYDVKNDVFEPFIQDYYLDINMKFDVTHVLSAADTAVTGQSSVIDNKNFSIGFILQNGKDHY